MKKYTITIEEIVDEDFTVMANNVNEALEKAEKNYRKSKFVLEPGIITYKQMRSSGIDPTEWKEF